MAKLAALMDHPNTPAHEAEAAERRWLELARKANREGVEWRR